MQINKNPKINESLKLHHKSRSICRLCSLIFLTHIFHHCHHASNISNRCIENARKIAERVLSFYVPSSTFFQNYNNKQFIRTNK